MVGKQGQINAAVEIVGDETCIGISILNLLELRL